MSYQSSYEIQGRFRFYDNEEHLQREWKQHARANIRQPTFLEGILLKSLDYERKHAFHLYIFVLLTYFIFLSHTNLK